MCPDERTEIHPAPLKVFKKLFGKYFRSREYQNLDHHAHLHTKYVLQQNTQQQR
jgi:hypothetical protein